MEDYIDYLMDVGYYDEAATLLAKAVNRDNFESRQVLLVLENLRYLRSYREKQNINCGCSCVS